MTLSIVDAEGVQRVALDLKVQDGGILRRIRRAKVLDSTSTLRTVATFVPPLSVAATATPIIYDIGYGGEYYQIVFTTFATPTGGLGPYTYVWTLLSGDDWTINNATASSANFSTTNELYNPGVAQVVASDASGQTATATVALIL